MLLPSAFPFDAFHQSQRPAPTSNSTPSSPGGFLSLSSCRTLQAILGSRPASPFPLRLSTDAQRKKDEKPATSTSNRPKQTRRPPLQPLEQNRKTSQRPRTRSQSQMKPSVSEPPRKNNKRTRADLESPTDENNISASRIDPDYFSYPHHTLSTSATRRTPPHHPQGRDRDIFSTPKRQCRVPLMMPFGLSAKDFEGLDSLTTTTTTNTATSSKLQPQPQTPPPQDQNMPSLSFATTDTHEDLANKSQEEHGYSPLDDRLLVSTVLTKLNLTHQDWNDCAREGDSLGRRWTALVGDGEEVGRGGLRRGGGGRRRQELLGREGWCEGSVGRKRSGVEGRIGRL